MQLDNSEIKAVDVCNGSTSTLKGEYSLKLMRAIDRKLRIVDLQDSFGKSSLRYGVLIINLCLHVSHIIHLAVLHLINPTGDVFLIKAGL